MKKLYVTITGMKHYYDMAPFKVGKKLRCVKQKNNLYDNEAIRVTIKGLGTVGYIANSPNTKVVGTVSAGAIGGKVKKKFNVKVIFITHSSIICKVVDGVK